MPRGRPAKKPGYDREAAIQKLIDRAVELAVEPFDENENRDDSLPTMSEIAKSMESTFLRVRKLLITADYFTSNTARTVQKLERQGLAITEIMKSTGLGRASVYSYLPYKKGAYNLKESMLYSEQGKRFRVRKAAVKALEEHKDLPDVSLYLWKAVIAFQDYPFRKLKVAAYCRISTDKSSQEESLETQRSTYEAMIRCNPGWEFAGIYVDEGRSGVTDKREGFQQMIADAKAGEINKILVKSISRFGRDILLCRQYVEELAAHNVSVYFEREGIDSLNPGTLMLLSLSAAIAQDESRSNSENHHWSNRRRVEMGIYKIGNNQVLGYDADKDGKPVPNKRLLLILSASVII